MEDAHHSRSKNLNWDLQDFKYMFRMEFFPFEHNWFTASRVRIYRITPGALHFWYFECKFRIAKLNFRYKLKL